MLHSLPKLKSIKLNVVSNFYNEEFMLPHWLEHHTKLFDHGILIDYASTDRSVEIVRDMAPDWEIVPADTMMFDAALNDRQLMEMESRCDGWKMTLNVTEFLFTSDLRQKVREIEAKGLDMVRSFGYRINDSRKEKEGRTFKPNEPLILQRFFGHPDPWRNRILHKKENGSYYVGRHIGTPGIQNCISPHSKYQYTLKDAPMAEGLYTLWYKFAPFYEQLPRKIQISGRVPESDRDKGYGWNHWDLNEDVLLERWEKELLDCKNLLNESHILAELARVENMYK